MSYCPQCKYEYPPQVTMCPECGDALVEKISENFAPAVSPDDSWVLIGGVTSEGKARVARGSLDSNNIPSVFMPSKPDKLAEKEVIDPNPILVDAGADLILVPKEFGDEAKLLLQAILGDELIQPVVENPLI